MLACVIEHYPENYHRVYLKAQPLPAKQFQNRFISNGFV